MIQLTEKYQVLPDMPPEQFEALKADIAERGVLVPVDVDEQGHILDGHHRYRACVELGVTDFPTIVRPGLTEEDRRIFARKSNMLRRHLNRAQVRYLVAEQLKDTPSWANNRIAQMLGVDSKTVQALRRKLERTSEIPKLDKLIGADGKTRPVKQKRPPAIMAVNADELHSILTHILKGGNAEELQGFLSEQSLVTFYTPDYDPFGGCDENGVREWHIFMLFLVQRCRFFPDGAGIHVEWLLGKDFKTPSEWMGEEGAKFRRSYGGRDLSKAIMKGWEKCLAGHNNKSLSAIQELLDTEAAKHGPGGWAQ